ncbi:sugar transferase [Shouchella shacheensis]|uniref:sugar transferase n=1 Tax=Shouchella shacheensis TaxID=1649580 RepID=UPI00073FC37B|nr:sugar transferase [Shouchella shacheensis]
MYKAFFKRIIDILLSLVALIALSPLIIGLAIGIKVESPGPILFKQKRIGRKAEHFQIYKFRSMKIDTPNVATDKLEDPEQYVTKTGKFIRKTSLDELPQLFNILIGDMSVVGPRPALYNQYELTQMRDEKNIHELRPGLTGYAQVRGRDMITDQEKVGYDFFYLSHLSFIFDIKIIVKTFLSVAKSDGIKG